MMQSYYCTLWVRRFDVESKLSAAQIDLLHCSLAIAVLHDEPICDSRAMVEYNCDIWY